MKNVRRWSSRDVVRVATRRSRLALAQTKLVVDALRERNNLTFEIVGITTTGDAHADRSIAAIGGDGVFVTELFAALLDDRADIAVHSAKDLPTATPAGLCCAAIPPREDARDVLLAAERDVLGLGDLGEHALVGTSSLRRASQVRLARPDLRVIALRGNVETRIRKLRDGQCAATILALAGLRRAGIWEAEASAVLGYEEMVPAVAQGALYVQCREADEELVSVLKQIDHAPSALAVRMERAFLAKVGGGCLAPVGAHVQIESGRWRLWAIIAASDGSAAVRRSEAGNALDAAEAVAAVEAVAQQMLAAGGQELIARARLAVGMEK